MNALLFDSDFILSLCFKEESTHAEAQRLYQNMHVTVEHILPQVHFEVVTVCSRKYSYERARDLHGYIQRDLKRVSAVPSEQEIWDEFFTHPKKSISYVDCANLVTARKYGWKIASFDAFYPKSLRLT